MNADKLTTRRIARECAELFAKSGRPESQRSSFIRGAWQVAEKSHPALTPYRHDFMTYAGVSQ